MKVKRFGMAAGFAMAVGTVMLGGCGWTPRDTYQDAQKVTFTADRGDRSVIVFTPETWPTHPANPSLADAR